jgi:hypothetical protein
MWKTSSARSFRDAARDGDGRGVGLRPARDVAALVNDVKADPAFVGIALWDASND